MKNISDLLRTGNLTPKERILLLIHDDINELKTGKKTLTEADIYALSDGWKPKDNFEVREYNKYFYTWEVLRYLKMDMQTLYLNSLIDIKDTERILAYFVYKNVKDYKNIFEKKSSEETKGKILEEILRNTGLDYGSLIHKLTFENVDEKVKKDLLALNPDSESNASYFDDEEKLYEILKDKTSITKEESGKLTELVLNSIPWEYSKPIFEKGLNFSNILFHGYFASVPMMEFVNRLAKKLHIEYKDEEDLKEKISKLPNLKSQFKEIIQDEINSGFFFSEFVPLCNSEEHTTCNESGTKLKHKEIIEIWIKEKKKSKEFIQKYINEGKLVVEERYKELFTIRKYYKSITGESLYNLEENLKFVEDYKIQVNKMIILGHLSYLIKNRGFVKKYGELLYFNKTLEKVSELLEVDLSFYGEDYTKTIREEIESVNKEFSMVYDKMDGDIYLTEGIKYYIEIYLNDMQINLDDIEPTSNECFEIFEKRMEELFGRVWVSL